jgi:hypothetical protein
MEVERKWPDHTSAAVRFALVAILGSHRRACPLVRLTVMMVVGSLFIFNRTSAGSGPSKQCPAVGRRAATLAPPHLAFAVVHRCFSPAEAQQVHSTTSSRIDVRFGAD